MKTVQVNRTIYTNGEKLIYYQDRLAKLQKQMQVVIEKIEKLSLANADEYTTQDWDSDAAKDLANAIKKSETK